MSPVVLADTGPIVAFLNRRDQHHNWAVEQFKTHPLPFLTCEPVLTEAAYLLARSGLNAGTVFDLVLSGGLVSAFQIRPEVEIVKAMLERYRNVPMDLADACMVRMAELHPSASVLTLDSDFHIYRTNKKEPISLLTT